MVGTVEALKMNCLICHFFFLLFLRNINYFRCIMWHFSVHTWYKVNAVVKLSNKFNFNKWLVSGELLVTLSLILLSLDFQLSFVAANSRDLPALSFLRSSQDLHFFFSIKIFRKGIFYIPFQIASPRAKKHHPCLCLSLWAELWSFMPLKEEGRGKGIG